MIKKDTVLKTFSLKTFIALSLLFSIGAHAAAADKKPVGASAKEYAVTVEVKDAKVIISAKGASGYHCNILYPWKLKVSDKIYVKKDAEKFAEDGVVFKVDAVKDRKAVLKLSVCNNAQCIMETAQLSW